MGQVLLVEIHYAPYVFNCWHDRSYMDVLIFRRIYYKGGVLIALASRSCHFFLNCSFAAAICLVQFEIFIIWGDRSAQLKDYWLVAFNTAVWFIWHSRNRSDLMVLWLLLGIFNLLARKILSFLLRGLIKKI